MASAKVSMTESKVAGNAGGGRLGKWMCVVLVTSADMFAQCERSP